MPTVDMEAQKTCFKTWRSVRVLSLLGPVVYLLHFWQNRYFSTVRLLGPPYLETPQSPVCIQCRTISNIHKTELYQLEEIWRRSLQPEHNKTANMFDILLNNSNETILSSLRTLVAERETSKDNKYTYTVKYIDTLVQDQVWVQIEEKYKGKRSRGGTNFKVYARTSQMYGGCDVEDFFNGTYLSTCPFLGNTSKVYILRTFTNYSAFLDQEPHQAKDKKHFFRVLLNSQVPVRFQNKKVVRPYDARIYMLFNKTFPLCDDSSQREFKSVFSRPIAVHGEIYWQWTMASGCRIPVVPMQRFRECSNRWENVIFLGDSHIRYMYYYWVQSMNDSVWLPKRSHGNHTLSNIHFSWNAFARTLKDKISMHLKNFNDDSSQDAKNILLFDCGSWDHKYKPTAAYMKQMADVAGFLKNVLATEMKKRWEIVWVTSAPDKERNIPRKGYKRNTYMTAATNQWIAPLMREAGVHVFDFYALAYPMSQKAVCGDHTLCLNETSHRVFGDTGYSIMDVLFYKFCR